jgi:hypothetical protein
MCRSSHICSGPVWAFLYKLFFHGRLIPVSRGCAHSGSAWLRPGEERPVGRSRETT